MLLRAQSLKGTELGALNLQFAAPDGDTVRDFYFDDRDWDVQYIVAGSQRWFNHTRVLYAIDSDTRPVLKPFTANTTYRMFRRYQSQPMWREFAHGANRPSVLQTDVDCYSSQGSQEHESDLRSTKELCGYRIQTADGEVGHVHDFIIDDETWTIRYLILDTRTWWHGKHALVPPSCIERISLNESKVFVSLPRETILQAPEFTQETRIAPAYESMLKRYYSHEHASRAC